MKKGLEAYPYRLHPLERIQLNESEVTAFKTARMLDQHQSHVGRNNAGSQSRRHGASWLSFEQIGEA